MQLWTPLFGFAFFALAFAVGDIVSYKTKGLISAIIIGAFIYMAGFWTGVIPKDTVTTTGLMQAMSNFGIPIMICGLGTMINMDEFIAEWKTVVIALTGIVGIAIACFTVGTLIFGRVYAYSAAAPISGGIIAATITAATAVANNRPEIGAFAMLVVSFQMFIGMPVASYMLKKECNTLLSSGKLAAEETTAARKFSIRIIPELPAKVQTTAMLLGKLALVAYIGATIAGFTLIPGSKPANYYLNPAVAYLLFGVLATELGFLEKNAVAKSNSMGFLMLGLYCLTPNSFASLSPKQFIGMLFPVAGLLILGAIGIALTAIPMGKLLGISLPVSVAIGVCAMIGYPGTQIITEEVLKGLDATDAQKAMLSKRLLPKMLVGGFTTVTIASVAFAGVMSGYIFR